MAIVFGTASRSAEVSRAVKSGRMRKIAAMLYTDDLTSPSEEIVRRHRLEIAAHFYPGALISHRSALEADISPGGKLHLTLPRAVAPVRKLPGLEIRIWRGPEPQAEDIRIPLGNGSGNDFRFWMHQFYLPRTRSRAPYHVCSAPIPSCASRARRWVMATASIWSFIS